MAPDVGRPGWLDLASPDPEAARRFYCGLFGWAAYTLVVPGYGDYDIFTLGDEQGPEAGGMQRLADDTQPSSWTCYFQVEDLQATVKVVEAEHGQELIPPADYAGVGTMALCMDAQGADFGISLPSDVFGFGAMDEPSALCWVELACGDIQDACRFYGRVFGWRAADRDGYTVLAVGDRPVGGVVRSEERWPQDSPAQWIPCFWVPDCDATAARATELGARVRIPPLDIHPGRYSMLADPTGARLAIVTPAQRSKALIS